MDHGIRISTSGNDVKTCDDKDTVVTSKYNTFKGTQSGNGSLSIYDATGTFTAATSDVITSAGHGLSNGQTIYVYTDDTLPAGLSMYVVYYIIQKTTDTFKVSLTSGGSAVDITSTGSGTHYWDQISVATVAHNLGYVPFAQSYFKESTSDYWLPSPYYTGGIGVLVSVKSYCDATNFYIVFWITGLGALTYNYQYFIYLDKAKLT